MRKFVASLLIPLFISASAAETVEVRSSRQVVIDNSEAVGVHSIQIDTGHGAVFAGSVYSSGSAWAVKTDQDGRAVWRITVPSESPQIPADASAFDDSAIIDNGVTVLCGHVGVQPPAPRPDYLLFISKSGQKLFEKRFIPQDNEVVISSISKCVAWNGGILIVGNVSKRGPYGPESPSGSYYWIAFLDASRNVKWEREIPRTIGSELSTSLRVIKDGSVVFSMTDNRDSQVVRVNKDGSILAGDMLVGAYTLIQPDNTSAPVRLLPVMYDMHWELVTLDDQLKIIYRTSSDKKLNMVVRSAWSIRDSGLVVFGESVRNGALRWAAIRRVSDNMEKIIDVNASFLNQTFTISSVNYDSPLRQFVLAYSVIEPSKAGEAKRTYLEQFTD